MPELSFRPLVRGAGVLALCLNAEDQPGPYSFHTLVERLDLKPGRSHFHAQRFDLVAAGDCTAIVVGEHNDWPPMEFRVEDPLAADVEVVAVDQCDGHYDTR